MSFKRFEHQFLVQIAYVPVKSKLASGPARLHLLDYMFCLTAGVPPKLLGIWPLRELRRFGVVDGKFCFEGGSRCGKGEGLHVLLTNQAKDLVQAFDMASRGRLPGKRKVSVRKNTSGVDGNTHSSLTGGSRPCSGTATSENEKLETCSSESSTKPFAQFRF
ncbi:protein Dok-7 [Caerostris extrusa]|uniref:Protein Dok-7 n=1 Tax=Caerostris extrusa TaxID=172846 RepID=A0AAV4QFZ3_CAEEX|nr:protein Dok-7 [Caerostris extrusa]